MWKTTFPVAERRSYGNYICLRKRKERTSCSEVLHFPALEADSNRNQFVATLYLYIQVIHTQNDPEVFESTTSLTKHLQKRGCLPNSRNHNVSEKCFYTSLYPGPGNGVKNMNAILKANNFSRENRDALIVVSQLCKSVQLK